MIIPVVFSTDHNFIMPTGVAIMSLLEKSDDCQPHIYILQNDDVTDNDRNVLRSICYAYSASIDFISIGNIFDQSFQIRDISTPAYYRLLIPWLITEHEKIIYCDGDIIFNQSIKRIFTFDIGNNLVAGIRTGFKRHTSVGHHIESLGLEIDEYINSGILLINAKKHRELNLKDDYLTHAKKQYTFQDQDIVNIVCKGNIGFMPRWFNTTPNAVIDLDLIPSDQNINTANGDCITSPVIIHYAGAKPWKEFTYWWLAWWETYKKSPFYDPMLEFQIEKKTLTKIPQLRPAFSKYIRNKMPLIGKLIDKIR